MISLMRRKSLLVPFRDSSSRDKFVRLRFMFATLTLVSALFISTETREPLPCHTKIRSR